MAKLSYFYLCLISILGTVIARASPQQWQRRVWRGSLGGSRPYRDRRHCRATTTSIATNTGARVPTTATQIRTWQPPSCVYCGRYLPSTTSLVLLDIQIYSSATYPPAYFKLTHVRFSLLQFQVDVGRWSVTIPQASSLRFSRASPLLCWRTRCCVIFSFELYGSPGVYTHSFNWYLYIQNVQKGR